MSNRVDISSGRQVVFVGGTAYSGSTLLCLTLANHPEGFATGEVQHAFYPWMPAHRDYLNKCTCGDSPCPLWSRVVEGGSRDVYSELFRTEADLRFLVDSSKNVFWTRDHSQRLRSQGIQTKHILVWKSPAQLKASYEKRGLGHTWLKDWLFYHRLYFALMPDHLTLAYSDYTADPIASLRSACDYTSLEYFENKEKYWDKRYHSLGGNPSARVHLYDNDSSEFVNAQKSIARRKASESPAEHKKIYQVSTEGDDELIQDSSMAQLLLEYLRAGAPVDDPVRDELTFSRPQIALARTKLGINRRFGRLRHGL